MRVLFVGNSHTYFNDMPELFARMCERLTGEKPEVTMLAFSGRPLAWHRKEYFSLRFALLHGGVDYCVLQQQAHPFPGEEETRAAVEPIIQLCRKAGAKPVLFATWAKRAEPEMAVTMSRFYRALSGETGALLAPIGDLFSKVQAEHPDIDLYWKDGAHASPYGSWLCAAALAALLSDSRVIEDLPCRGFDFDPKFSDEGGTPTAEENVDAEAVQLDPEKTRVLGKTVESVLFDK